MSHWMLRVVALGIVVCDMRDGTCSMAEGTLGPLQGLLAAGMAGAGTRDMAAGLTLSSRCHAGAHVGGRLEVGGEEIRPRL